MSLYRDGYKTNRVWSHWYSTSWCQRSRLLPCRVEGPDDFDVLFESIIDAQFGHDQNSEYKQWIRRLYELGFIPRLPDEWK